MADDVIAKGEAQRTPHPEGQFSALCVDVVDLGERVEQFQDKPRRIVQKVALVFRTGELNDEGQPFDIGSEFTVSMHENAGLRKFLEDWRGKSYTEEQALEGVPLGKLAGNAGLVAIEQKRSGKGRLYAKIKTITPLPKAIPAPKVDGYERPEYWDERKKEYAEGVAKLRAELGKGKKKNGTTARAESLDDFPEALDTEDDDDLPF